MSKSTTRKRFVRSLLGTAAMASLLTNCAALDRIKQLGEPVTLTPIDNPTAKPGYKPVQMPMPNPQPAVYNPNSLWRNGSRAFFNDQRAHQVGDILTVKVNINDTAAFNDQTQLTRTSTEDTEISNFIGANTIKGAAQAVLPGSVLTASGNSQMNGQGVINRTDQLLHQHRCGRDPALAERQHGDRRQAGNPPQQRSARTHRRRRCAA
jgi:flagellar L-ring protein FlgH